MSSKAIELGVRWAARVGSIASLLLLSSFIFGPNEADKWPTAQEWAGLAFFPGGVAAGMLLGWWKERLGGAVTVASLAGFYAWLFLTSGRIWAGPWFFVFAAPGFLFLLADWLSTRSPAQRANFA